MAVSPDGARVFAARNGAIDFIDTATAQWVGRRQLSGTPLDLAVTASRAVVVQTGGKVAVLNLTTGRLVRRLNLPGAAGVSIAPTGEAWVSATTPRKGKRRANSRLVRIASTNGVVTGSIDLGTDGGGGVSVGPEGTKAIVAPGANLAAPVPAGRARRPGPAARARPHRDRQRAGARLVRVRRRAALRQQHAPRDGLHPLRDQRQAPAHGDPVRRGRADGPARARAVHRHRSWRDR